jgi:hypothetical protein
VRFVAVQFFQPMRRQALAQRLRPDGWLMLDFLQVAGVEGVVENFMSAILVNFPLALRPSVRRVAGQRRAQLAGQVVRALDDGHGVGHIQ